MSRRKIAVAVGSLFVAQVVTALFGTSLSQAFVDGDTNRTPLTAGVVHHRSEPLTTATPV